MGYEIVAIWLKPTPIEIFINNNFFFLSAVIIGMVALQKSLDRLRRQAAELQASRARIVAAADSERRRIERNLHDGAQQHLTALAIKLRLVSELAEQDRAQAKDLLEEVSCEVNDAARELRDLAHGIYPPLLAESGLPTALSAAVRWSTMPTTLDAAPLGRYPAEVEATVYFCCPAPQRGTTVSGSIPASPCADAG
jgi:signal transduction histidine kinase